MNPNIKHISVGVASLMAGTLLLAGPDAAGAESPQRFDICPAIDSEPLCDVDPAEAPTNGGASTASAFAVQAADRRGAYFGCSRRPWLVVLACPF